RPPGGGGQPEERVDAPLDVVGRQRRERLLGEPARLRRVAVPGEGDAGERRQRTPGQVAVTACAGLVADDRHLVRNRRELAELDRRLRGELPARRGRLQLDRADEQPARVREGAAAKRPRARRLERRAGLGAERRVDALVELRKERARALEV